MSGTQSWRPQRREGSIDPLMVRMAAIAGAVALALAAAFGGYSLLGRSPGAVPVIEADSRPVRVRPDNPGGMQVAGAEEQIMDGAGNGQADVMAPPPETPQPAALRAQIQAARQPEPKPAAPPAIAAATPAPAAPAALDQRAVPAIAARPAGHDTAPPAAGTGMEVQLAATETQDGAIAEWRRLSKRMPDLLGNRRMSVQRAERDGNTVFRLRTGGFADTAQATMFCVQVRAKGAGCAIASF